MNFGLETEVLDPGIGVLALRGEVDLYTAPQVKQELLRLIDEGARNVIVDLAETTFIDSTALGVLIGGLKRLRPSGGDLPLVIADRNIRKIFDITGLDQAFRIHETRANAVAGARGDGG